MNKQKKDTLGEQLAREQRDDRYIIIHVDKTLFDLVGFLTVYTHKGPIPVMYPPAALQSARYGSGYDVDFEKGSVAIPLNAVRSAYAANGIDAVLNFVRDYIDTVKQL